MTTSSVTTEVNEIADQQDLAIARIQEASDASQNARLHAQLATELLKSVIESGREVGVTWADIGKIIGMSPQRAFDLVARQPVPETAVPGK